MSLPDDWSGLGGPCPDITLFGTPKHGKVLYHYSSLGTSTWKLHLPNGVIETHGPESTLFASINPQQPPVYGQGGTCFYWKRPDIGPPPTRTPAQQAYDLANGHQWRNDRINHGWYWCDEAGDRWRVTLQPLSSGSGTSRTVRVELTLAGALNEPAITRQQEILVTDPADMALAANFYERGDQQWGLRMEDAHPSGQRALFAITRRVVNPGDSSNWLAHSFTLFTLSSSAWESLGYSGIGNASFTMPYTPSPIGTAYLEIALTGAARDSTWAATPSTVRSRLQTYGTFSSSTDATVDDVWAWPFHWVVSYEPMEVPGVPDAQRIIWSAGSNTTVYGTNPDGFVTPPTPPTVGVGSGLYSLTGRDMVVGVFYDEAGAIAVLSVDVDYSHAFYSDLTVTKSGTRIAYSWAGEPPPPPTEDTRQVIDDKNAGVDAQARLALKLNGVQLFEHSCRWKWDLSVSTTFAYSAAGSESQSPSQIAADWTGTKTYKVGGIEYTTPFDPKRDFGTAHILGGSWQYNAVPNLGEDAVVNSTEMLFDPTLAGVIDWAVRFGFKELHGPRADGPPANSAEGPSAGQVLWHFALTRASNNVVQYRGAGNQGGWTILDPIVCPTGLEAGTPVAAYSTTPPPIHVSYDPFSMTVAHETRMVTFV